MKNNREDGNKRENKILNNTIIINHLWKRFRIFDSSPVVDLVHFLHVPGQRTLPSHPLAVLAPNSWQLEDLPGAGLHMTTIHVSTAFGAENAHDLMRLESTLAVKSLIADLATKLENHSQEIKH